LLFAPRNFPPLLFFFSATSQFFDEVKSKQTRHRR
jgi:hypothetical protein